MKSSLCEGDRLGKDGPEKSSRPFCLLSSFNDVVGGFYDAVLGVNSAKGREGIDRGVFADDRAGIEDATTADVGVVCEDCSDLSEPCFILGVTVNYDLFAVAFEVRAY